MGTFVPRPCQLAAADFGTNFLASAGRGHRQVIASPTGSGKTWVELEILRRVGGDCWLLTPRIEIARGVAEKAGLPEARSLRELVENLWRIRVSTPIRFRNALVRGDVPRVSAIIGDEGHHSLASSYEDIQGLCGLPPTLLFTATPFRGTSRGTAKFLQEWCNPNEVIWMVTLREAAKLNYISIPECHTLALLDDDEVQVTAAGEFDARSASDAMGTRVEDLAGRAIELGWWHAESWGVPTVFCLPSTETARSLCTALARRGALAIPVTAGTPDPIRREAFDLLRRGLAAVSQVNVLGEGVDLPVRRLVDAHPRMSPVSAMQAWGRCVAEGEPVLTDRGWVPIELVHSEDKVWDGEEWVAHGGVMYNGTREVIETCGVRMTPDHEVLTRRGWKWASGLRSSDLLGLGRYMDDGRFLLRQNEVGDRRTEHRLDKCCASASVGASSSSRPISSGLAIRSNAAAAGTGKMCQKVSLNAESGYSLVCGLLSSDARTKNMPHTDITGVVGFACAKRGSKTRLPSSSICSRCLVTMIPTYLSIGSIMMGTMNRETFGSRPWSSSDKTRGMGSCSIGFSGAYNNCTHGACQSKNWQSAYVYQRTKSSSTCRVYDIANCGPRNRYQVRGLIVHNCTRPVGPAGPPPELWCCNRNLQRFAYLFDGLLPSRVVAEAETVFGGPGRRAGHRSLGLEALGRFKACEAKLLDGCSLLLYSLWSNSGGRSREISCIQHPIEAEPIWCERVRGSKPDGSVDYGRWVRLDKPPESVQGFSSVAPREPSEKMVAWWRRSAESRGLDPNQEVTRKSFCVLPILFDLGLRYRS